MQKQLDNKNSNTKYTQTQNVNAVDETFNNNCVHCPNLATAGVLERVECQLSNASIMMAIGWILAAFESVLHTSFESLITTAYVVRVMQPRRF
jgi:hypothetical protein